MLIVAADSNRATSCSGSLSGRSFSVQYTSLILIILTCIIGAFIKGAPTSPVHREADVPVELARLTYGDLFSAGGAVLNSNALSGVVQVLLSHDISAEIMVTGDVATAPDRELNMRLGLTRAGRLARELRMRGVPQNAVRVYAVEAHNAIPQVTLQLNKVQE